MLCLIFERQYKFYENQRLKLNTDLDEDFISSLFPPLKRNSVYLKYFQISRFHFSVFSSYVNGLETNFNILIT